MSTTSSQLPGPSSRHARLLRQFNEDIFKRHVLTDVELVVEGKLFKCHRALLVCFSPALKRKLLGSDGKPITKKTMARVGEAGQILVDEFQTPEATTSQPGRGTLCGSCTYQL
ncbi:BTB domain-containing protein [Trichonephila clavipes]|nr:BTB domain-containing protein [Trichonephila clavipes]